MTLVNMPIRKLEAKYHIYNVSYVFDDVNFLHFGELKM